ncbi:MAG: NAD(P)/FAD-dependent oxidoreductase [Gemmatimonadales bacterium]
MKRVVIVGGGFVGIYLAKALKRAPVQVTVIDRRNHHLFQPLLYQVAAAELSPADIAAPIRSIVRSQRNTEVLLGEAVGVDPARKVVALADGAEFGYDWLVLAPGTRHSYYGRPEWESLAPGLKTLEDAQEIRRRVLLAFELAEREPDPVRRQALLTFVVVGGGPTGVELAGALAEIRRFALARDFRRIDPREATVMLLEGGTRLLPMYPERLSERAKLDLRRKGVEVRLEMLVEEIQPGMVRSRGWTIPTQTVVWAAGNQASPLLTSLGVPLDRFGRVEVEPDCSVPGHPELFVMGDAAAFRHDPRHETLPGLCPVAIQQGKYAAEVIRADLAGKPRKPFRYWDKGQAAVIGRGRGVCDIGVLQFGGFPAWLVWLFIHIFFLIGFRNRVLVLMQWAFSFVTLQRGARLIPDGGAPTAALPPPPPATRPPG